MKKTILNLAVAASLGFSAQGFAHEGGMVNDAFVGDSAGHVVTDGSGDCARTSSWSEDKLIEGCGLVVAAPVVEAAPVTHAVSETVSLSASALFALNSAEFNRDQPQLDELAARVKGLSSIESIDIVGHTDSSGTDAYNQALSVRRAEAVKNYLIAKDVNPAIMTTSGMGESQPVASNATSEGRAQNRRVDISFKGTEIVK